MATKTQSYAEETDLEPGDIVVRFNGKAQKPTEYVPLKPGKYNAAVSNVSEKTGQASGAPYLAVEFRITGPNGATGKVRANMTLQEDKNFMLGQLLLALGHSEDSLNGNDEVTDNYFTWYNRPVIVRLKQKNYTRQDGTPGTTVEIAAILEDDGSLDDDVAF